MRNDKSAIGNPLFALTMALDQGYRNFQLVPRHLR